ncbi:MAG: hypothetical protein IGS50_12440 [Synechococcales cyanobacterium C42_A2020_086]|jgi:hypothetical protein|nr:hypothetical protein [Synechococcales cyanobacterium C42_A2020_086]
MPRIRIRIHQLEDRHQIAHLSDRIAIITETLRRPGKGGRKARCKAAYFGFPTQADAIRFASTIRGRFPKVRLEVRTSERLSTPIEVKIAGDMGEQLAWELLKTSESTRERVERHLKVVAARPSIAPDTPVQPRSAGRTMARSASGHLVGID